MMFKTTLITALLGSLLLVAGCGGEEEGPGPYEGDDGKGDVTGTGTSPGSSNNGGGCAVDLTGTWSGTWTSMTASGTWTVPFKQDASGKLTGTLALTGTVCGAGGPITGSVNGCSIKFGLANVTLCKVEYQGTVGVDGKTMSGTFSASAMGMTDGGSWQGSR